MEHENKWNDILVGTWGNIWRTTVLRICTTFSVDFIISLVFSWPIVRLMTREKALGIALGNINPITGEMIADFDPKKIKVRYRTRFWDILLNVLYFWPTMKRFSSHADIWYKVTKVKILFWWSWWMWGRKQILKNFKNFCVKHMWLLVTTRCIQYF